jgi:hypothetical protein
MMAFPWQSSMDWAKSCQSFVDKVNGTSEHVAEARDPTAKADSEWQDRISRR